MALHPPTTVIRIVFVPTYRLCSTGLMPSWTLEFQSMPQVAPLSKHPCMPQPLQLCTSSRGFLPAGVEKETMPA